jgi:ADP-ribose pyrophosphatase YjhB (NUDIX family)
MNVPQWLDWAQRLAALAQAGLSYDPQPFDRQRYEQLREIAAEMLAAQGDIAFEPAKLLLEDERGHPTPKVDCRAVVIRDEKVLLVQEKLDNNRWTLPGGWVDVGESPSRAVEREAWEESGYRVRAVKLLALYDRNLHDHPPHFYHIYKLFFRCELLSEERDDAPNLETAGVAFWGLDELPELSIGRVTRAQLARFFEHHHQPDLPTDFD